MSGYSLFWWQEMFSTRLENVGFRDSWKFTTLPLKYIWPKYVEVKRKKQNKMQSTDLNRDYMQLLYPAVQQTIKPQSAAVCASRCTIRRWFWKMSKHNNCITHSATGNMPWLVRGYFLWWVCLRKYSLHGFIKRTRKILQHKHLKRKKKKNPLKLISSSVPRLLTSHYSYSSPALHSQWQGCFCRASIDLQINMVIQADVGWTAMTSLMPQKALKLD